MDIPKGKTKKKKDDINVRQKITKENVKKYIKRYVAEYRSYLVKKYPDRKNEFSLYKKYPVHIKAYVTKISTLIFYKYNTPKLKIEVFEVDHIPNWKSIEKNTFESWTNYYFLEHINKPKEVARRHIEEIIGYEEIKKEEEEHYAKLAEQLYEEQIDLTIDQSLKYMEKAYRVKKETLDNERYDIFSICNIIMEMDFFSAYDKLECTTLSMIWFELQEDIDSTFFLCLHGKYRPANALLRRWLETYIIALYFDFKLKEINKKSKSYKNMVNKRDSWLSKSKRLRFTGEDYSILAQLIDPDTDYYANQIMKKTTPNYNHKFFRNYIEQIYRDLSKSVHYGGWTVIDSPIDFAEYNEKQFENWYVKFHQINEICNILLYLRFPEILNLKKKFKNIIIPPLPENKIKELKKLLKNVI